MNEIENLYENAGIERTAHCVLCDNPCPDDCYTGYLFTADKQIELIKWLSKRSLLNITFSNDKSTYHLFNDKCTGSFCSDLATAIATLVQCELDFCTEDEKKQIKEILQ